MSVDSLRVAVQNAVNRTSLRRVAKDIGLSAPGLALFLDGSIPRDTTLVKIRDWYFGDAVSRSDTTPDTARTAIELLLEPMPDQALRDRVCAGVLALLTKAYEKEGIVAPLWLRELTAEPRGIEPTTDPGR